MITNQTKLGLFFLLAISIFCSCQNNPTPTAEEIEKLHLQQKKQMETAMTKHLNAVSNKDLTTLKSTMHPDGKMQLILDGQPIIEKVEGFMSFHEEWFKDANWTFETKILNSEVGETLGMAIVDAMYREPERDGKPYYNHMIVSYVLENVNGNWVVIKDHATSVEKSTDKK